MTTKTPTGPVQQRWYAEGYRAAMAELAEMLDRGDDAAMREYIENARPQRQAARA